MYIIYIESCVLKDACACWPYKSKKSSSLAAAHTMVEKIKNNKSVRPYYPCCSLALSKYMRVCTSYWEGLKIIKCIFLYFFFLYTTNYTTERPDAVGPAADSAD